MLLRSTIAAGLVALSALIAAAPVVALMSTGPKAAVFAVLLRVLFETGAPDLLSDGWLEMPVPTDCEQRVRPPAQHVPGHPDERRVVLLFAQTPECRDDKRFVGNAKRTPRRISRFFPRHSLGDKAVFQELQMCADLA